MHYSTGAGGIKRLGQYLNKKQCLITIKPNKDDSLCTLRAIIVGKARVEKDCDYGMIRSSRNSYQTRLAYKLASDVGLAYNKPCGITEIKLVEQFLKH